MNQERAIPAGTYSTPYGNFGVEYPMEGEAYIWWDAGGTRVGCCFRDGRYSHFEVEGPVASAQVDSALKAVYVCEHIVPGYQGTVYLQQGAVQGVTLVVCPECVTIRAEVAKCPVSTIALEVWDDMRRNLQVVPVEAFAPAAGG